MRERARGIKVVVSAVYWLLFLSWRGVARRVGLFRNARCVTLLYHGVRTEDRERFEAQMRVLRRLVQPINLEHCGEAASGGREGLEGGRPTGGLFVAVTFDDGFASVAENALDALVRLNIPATIFVPVAYVGQKPGWDAGADEDELIMDEGQLRALPEGLVSIASHSVTHPHLPELDEETLRWEMTHSREVLEQIIGRRVRFFSYPYGERSFRVDAAAFAAGYEMTFALDPRPCRLGRNVVMGRVCVEPGDGPIEFRLKLLGAYRWMPWASRIKRALKSLARPLVGRKEMIDFHDRFARSTTKG